MSVYLPQDDNPIRGEDRTQAHATNEARAILDPRQYKPPYNRRSGWSWKTIFDYLTSNLWQDNPAAGLAMTWRGEWKAQEYNAGAVVRDELWTMIANKTTQDPAAPVLAGSPTWLVDDVPAWVQATPSATVVASGMQFTPENEAQMAIALRVWISAFGANITHTIRIREVLGDGIYREIVNQPITAAGTGWLVVNIQGTHFEVGKTYDAALVVTDQTTETSNVGNWVHSQSTAAATPGIGQSYLRLSTGVFAINKTDSDLTDHDAELALVVPGSQFRFDNGAIYTVTALGVAGPDVYTFEVSTLGGAPTGLTEITYTVPTPATIPYEVLADHWLADDRVSGLLDVDGAGIVLSNDAHGFDLQLDAVVVSPDWEVVAFSADLSA